jgi:insecticidal toxin complex protein TccC
VGITNNQLRYSLTDSLSSSVMELDDSAQMISKETYTPYGATATLAARSQIEVDYKFIRYSGREMNNAGLYDYGARYYAPWLCRWISSDPAGDNDGLNRYAFVGSNPITYFDNGGTQRKPSEQRQMINDQVAYLSTAQQNLDEVNQQFGDLTSPAKFRLKVLKNFISLAGRATVGFFSAWAVTVQRKYNSWRTARAVIGKLHG